MNIIIDDIHTKYINIIEEHVKNIEDIIRPINIHPEGNSFYEHSTLKRYPDLLNKQKNLVWCGTNIYDNHLQWILLYFPTIYQKT